MSNSGIYSSLFFKARHERLYIHPLIHLTANSAEWRVIYTFPLFSVLCFSWKEIYLKINDLAMQEVVPEKYTRMVLLFLRIRFYITICFYRVFKSSRVFFKQFAILAR